MEYEYLSEQSTISINKLLGEGSTSHVYQCSLNNHQYAIKLLKDLPSVKSSFLQETQSLNEINHPNITNLINSGISKVQINNEIVERPYIILDYAEKGELFNYIYHPKKGIILNIPTITATNISLIRFAPGLNQRNIIIPT